MILAWLLLLTGLTLSAVAIYYSVVGLTAIFSAAAVPIMIMGVSLEVAKLVCATWIKQYWTQVPRLMKTYMVTAVVLLMFITSMGIFGFLSKAHNDQTLVSGDVGTKIAIYDEKIKTARDNIEAARKQLRQMDEAVDQVMGRSQDEKGADKAVAIRRGQAKDRAALAREIETNQKIVAQLNEEAAPIRAEVRKVEAEVGPIKYIAAFLYGVAPDATMLEKAVTWIIIMIVVVFDPLAVIMLLAAQMTFGWHRGVKPVVEEKDTEESKPNVFTQFTEKIRRKIHKDNTPDFEGVKLPDGTWVQTGPAFNTVAPEEYTDIDEINHRLAAAADAALKNEINYVVIDDADDEPVETDAPFKGLGTVPAMPLGTPYMSATVPKRKSRAKKTPKKTDEEIIAEVSELIAEETLQATENPNAPGLDVSAERPGDYVKTNEVKPMVREAAPAPNRGVMYSQSIVADNTPMTGRASHSDFGNVFPSNPEKGDIYLRTDYLPNRLYKFNGNKWIEVDKEQTDVYAYDSMYIKHLIEEIDAGRYDADSLTDVERDQIKEYLKKNVQ
jgi:hypothetical protein